ncbi:HNH endonuclease family protein [Streptomyces sp. NPDC049915]|uniref:HNH endonuclease family protein n=1 Tax=Streptomyces sp. NPDC049915 TaxID=3155510 RepID=UPI003430B939
MRFPRAAVIAAALTALLLPAVAHADPAGATVRDPGQTLTAPVRDVLAQLSIAVEDRTGYQRDAFKHWVDADKDGCNTRAEVLQAEAVIAPEQGPRCTLTSGRWYSPYDDRYIDGPRCLDIDHLVPLAEAWDSGASRWSAAEREAYANDLGDERALIAVSAASNRSKADQDPTTWLPPAEGYRCKYVADWVADKMRWGLSIDPSEESALSENLSRCPNAPVTVTLAR